MSKQKANNISLQRRVARKVVPDPDDSDDKNTNGRSTLSTKTTDDTKEATECDSDADKVWAAYNQPRETVDKCHVRFFFFLFTDVCCTASHVTGFVLSLLL